jgi:hypothetical protein
VQVTVAKASASYPSLTKSMVHVNSIVLLSLEFGIPAAFALFFWPLLVYV